jgi:hypothetical protein
MISFYGLKLYIIFLEIFLGNSSVDITGSSRNFIKEDTTQQEYTAYLMAYFNPEEKLYYAYSYDAKNWETINNGLPVFESGVRLRDPFLNRTNKKYHLVHTKGWDHPTIYHWESVDLINWEGGPLHVVDSTKKRAWAPEFFYSREEQLFYVYWASLHDGHNAIHYVTTKDWSDITPDRSEVYYDLGIHDIDLTIVEKDGTYYGFHKPGSVEDKMGNLMFTSKSLRPKKHSFGKKGNGQVVFPGETKPTEGPEVIKLIDKELWYIYCDPFRKELEAWETADFENFIKIETQTPKDSKHCSFIQITQKELDTLLEIYPNNKSD